MILRNSQNLGIFMAFTINAQSVNYVERGEGVYSVEGADFSAPDNHFRFRPSTVVRANGTRDVTIIRKKEFELPNDDDDVRYPVALTLQITTPDNGAAAATDIESLCTDLSSVLTADIINRLLQGES